MKLYRYTLGVDLGVASIGTALTLIDQERNILKVLDLGVRRFPIPGGAATRREKRLERKHLRRRRQRLANLQKQLQPLGMYPTCIKARQSLLQTDPYTLRAKAVSEKLDNLHQLGRCFLHMAKFRGAGFLTQQEDVDAGETTQDKQKSAGTYRYLETLLNEKCLTLSQFFAQRLAEKQPVRRRKHLVELNKIEHAVPRFLVKEEFRRIWETQSQYYPELTDEHRDALYKAIFVEHPHAPYATGYCPFVEGEVRLPRMHRLAEKRRIYEQVNNIRYTTPEGESFLTKHQRDHLVALLFEQGQNLSKSEIKKQIAAMSARKVTQVNLAEGESSIKGFCHLAAFKNIPCWATLPDDEQNKVIDFIADPAIDPADPASVLYPEDEFLDRLCGMLQLSGEAGKLIASQALAKLAKDRSSLGMTATKKILEKLVQGYEVDVEDGTGQVMKTWRPHSHRSAADACEFVAEEERIRAMQGSCDFLPYYGEVLKQDVAPVHPWHKKRAVEEERRFGRIPNPVVHVALNQLRKVVNEIVSLYGKPQAIHVEFARELGMSAAKRDALVKELVKREAENSAIDAELHKLNLAGSRRNRTKYKLWKEQGERSMFSLKPIEASQIASCEIEHLIPQASGGTDSVMNLCLVFEDENKAKGTRFPYEAIQQIAPEKWSEISKIIHDKQYPKAKAWRFSPDAKERYSQEGDDAQTDHRLTDTSYIAKMGARYLRVLCPDVIAVKGGTTSYLRHLWGLDGIEYELFGLAVPEELVDADTGEVTIDPLTGYPMRNPLWAAKPRIDHRHHAIDALVVACTTRGMVKRLVWEEKNNRRLTHFPVPFGDSASDFRYQVLAALRTVKVSPKADHGLDGQLHDATKYRILQPKNPDDPDGSYFIRYNRSLALMKSKKDVENILFNTNTIPCDIPAIGRLFTKCQQLVETIQRHYPLAEETLEAERAEARSQDRKVRTLTAKAQEEAIVQKAIQLGQKAGVLGPTYPCVDSKRLVAINQKLQFGFEPKNNYRMDFFEGRNGKVGWECITRIEANDRTFIPTWRQDGHKHLWSVCIDDVIEVTPTDELSKSLGELHMPTPLYFVVQKMSEGRLQCNLLHDARSLDGRNTAIQGGIGKHVAYERWISGGKGLIYWCKHRARKVELTPFGKVLRKHKRLWSGKKA